MAFSPSCADRHLFYSNKGTNKRSQILFSARRWLPLAKSRRSGLQVTHGFRTFLSAFVLTFNAYRTYTFNDRRYGHYQPNGYGANYPGRNPPGQYPQGMPNEDRFRFDPVSKLITWQTWVRYNSILNTSLSDRNIYCGFPTRALSINFRDTKNWPPYQSSVPKDHP